VGANDPLPSVRARSACQRRDARAAAVPPFSGPRSRGTVFGSQASRHQHRCALQASGATANRACARGHHRRPDSSGVTCHASACRPGAGGRWLGARAQVPFAVAATCARTNTSKGSPISHPRQVKRINPYNRSRIPFLPRPVFQTAEFTAHLVLEQWLRRCAPVTHQDQGSVALRGPAPGCTRSPRKPSVPHRVQSTRRALPIAQVFGFATRAIQPLVAHGTGATNSFFSRFPLHPIQGGIGAGVQSGLMVLPTPRRHCRRRPH